MKTTEKNYHRDNKSFMVYKEWGEYINMLDDRQAGLLFKALFEFVINEKEATLEGMTAMAYAVMRNTIDRDGKKWEEKCRANSENINKRWSKQKDTTKYERIGNDTDHTDKDKDKEKVKVKEKAKEKDREKENDNVSESESVSVSDKEARFSEVDLSEEELADLVRQADRLTVDRYILKIIDWQRRNKKLSSKPYISIKKWIEEDGARPKSPCNENGISTEEYDAFARSIDFDKLSTK